MSAMSSSSSSPPPEPIKKQKKQKRKHEEHDSDSEGDTEQPNKKSEKPASEKRKHKAVDTDDKEDEKSDGADVKALSHKEQRRLRKKRKVMDTKEKDEDTQAENPSKKSKGKEKKLNPEKEQNATTKRQNSIWVGNLSFKTTADSLRTFFNGVGEITRIHMPTKLGAAGKGGKAENRGFAYVDFATPDAKTIAITFSETNLDGRRLLIKDGGDFTGRPAAPTGTASENTNGDAVSPSEKTIGSNSGTSKTAQKILSSQKQPPAPCLFLGNLGFEATEERIKEMIEGHAKTLAEKHNNKSKKEKKEKDADLTDEKPDEDVKADVGIRKIRMGTFEDSGLCKGFAFVDFNSIVHATAALTNPRNHFLDGRKLVVEYASPDAVRRGGYREKGVVGNKDFKDSRKSTSTHRSQYSGNKPDVQANDVADVDVTEENEVRRERRKDGKGDDRHPRPGRRAKPGAALALAQRETYAIVPSQGTKMTFT